ncbi:MAG: DNA repair protein RecO [Spirochaetaceae bacterium]|nr:MAG: DNA repair protein RecO [Spirochaetaceae bacterium]
MYAVTRSSSRRVTYTFFGAEMSRNARFRAVVLRASKFGEIHKNVTLFGEGRGLVSAIAHGANSRNGRLRAAVGQFTFGVCSTYTDPVKNVEKITEFEVIDHFSHVRDVLERFWAASLWCEILLKTYAGGETEGIFRSFVDALHEVTSAAPRDVRRITYQFLLRFLEDSGALPDLAGCSSCGCRVRSGDGVVALTDAGEPVCGKCGGASRTIPAGAVAYLSHTRRMVFRDAVRVALDEQAAAGVRSYLFSLLETHVDAPLNTLKLGDGVV